MNSEMIKTFLTIAETGNFTKAAQHLIVAQSTVTNRMKELENEIGQKLLIRNNKEVTLTHAGEHFLSYASQMADMESRMLDEINSINLYTKRLRVGSVNSIYCGYLQPYISAILRNHKTIQVSVTLTHSRSLIQDFYSNALDVIFSYSPLNKPGYKCMRFREEDVVLVTNAKNRAYADGICVKQLAELPIIYSKFAPKLGFDWIHSLFPTNHVFQMTISVMEKIIPYLLEQPYYYAFLPRSLVQKELRHRSLREVILLDFTIPKLTCYMITREKDSTHITQYFMD